MTIKVAFLGFRHPHIFDVYHRCCDRDDLEVVACCEEDSATREQLAADGNVQITHMCSEKMLSAIDCDFVAIGDCFGRRGKLAIQALEAGRHVLVDKPLCTSLEELDQIERLAKENQRVVGCMLDMRDLAVYLGLRDAIRSGSIGEIRAINFGGQHPLRFGSRPDWYYEPGMHGGTLNDIGIHAFDMIPWTTGLQFQQVVAARCWNGRLPQFPQFQECGQALLQLGNGAGVSCDVSYLSPDSFAFDIPLYWRFTFWGEDGVLEAGVTSKSLTLFRNGANEPEQIALPVPQPGGYLDAFLQEIAGETEGLHLSSAEVFRSSRVSLMVQSAADQKRSRMDL